MDVSCDDRYLYNEEKWSMKVKGRYNSFYEKVNTNNFEERSKLRLKNKTFSFSFSFRNIDNTMISEVYINPENIDNNESSSFDSCQTDISSLLSFVTQPDDRYIDPLLSCTEEYKFRETNFEDAGNNFAGNVKIYKCVRKDVDSFFDENIEFSSDHMLSHQKMYESPEVKTIAQTKISVDNLDKICRGNMLSAGSELIWTHDLREYYDECSMNQLETY